MHTQRQQPSSSRDAGAASVLVLAIVAAVIALVGFTVLLGKAMAARHEAQSAADLGALAAAETLQWGGAACESAARAVATNDAELVGCEVSGEYVVVRVRVPVAGVWASAAARAGPS